MARQLAELSLKALYGDYRKTKLKNTHSLTALLDALAARNDELLDDDPERAHIVAFIRDLQSHDQRGDQGRYPEASDGTPSLSTVCCAVPELLAQEIERMFCTWHAVSATANWPDNGFVANIVRLLHRRHALWVS